MFCSFKSHSIPKYVNFLNTSMLLSRAVFFGKIFIKIKFLNKCWYIDFKKLEVVRVVGNLFFISNYPHYHRLVETFFIKIYSIIYFSIPHYPHYLWLFKIYISTFIQKFFFKFQTTLTTTDLLKLVYQHLFKNFFFNSPLPSLPPTCCNLLYQHLF